MDAHILYHWLHNDPFVPFRFSLSNGRTFDVTNPEFGHLIDQTTFVLGEPDPDFRVPVSKRSEFIALAHINNITPLNVANPPAVA